MGSKGGLVHSLYGRGEVVLVITEAGNMDKCGPEKANYVHEGHEYEWPLPGPQTETQVTCAHDLSSLITAAISLAQLNVAVQTTLTQILSPDPSILKLITSSLHLTPNQWHLSCLQAPVEVHPVHVMSSH
jgi:hypothetical protein